MPTIHPATSFEAGKRVAYDSKKHEMEIKAKVKKILADVDKVILVPENGPNAGDDVTVPAKLLRKLRGPEPGTKRTPKVVEEEDDTETETQTSRKSKSKVADADAEELTEEVIEQMVDAFETMTGLLRGHLAFIRAQTSEKPAAKKGIMGKRRPMAEDDEEV